MLDWKDRITYWQKRLSESKNYPVLNELETTWQLLSSHYDGIISRENLPSVSDNIMGILLFHIELGFYPPPEIILTLKDMHDEYINGNGKLTLEEVFYGSPQKKAGNFSARTISKHKDIFLNMELMIGTQKGLSKIKIAEEFISKYKLDIDPESLLRNVRRKKRK